MTRRAFVSSAVFSTAIPKAAASVGHAPLIVPIHRVLDTRAACAPEQLRRFWSSIWPEAVRDFNRCGIQFQTTEATGEIKRSAADRPIFLGLERAAINLILTDYIPMYWDRGRGLAGVTTRYEGYHVCVIALSHAHGHQA